MHVALSVSVFECLYQLLFPVATAMPEPRSNSMDVVDMTVARSQLVDTDAAFAPGHAAAVSSRHGRARLPSEKKDANMQKEEDEKDKPKKHGRYLWVLARSKAL